jgi:HNH endonuclease
MPEPSKLCVYCLQAELTGEEKPEHPIPASLGSSLTVTTVCDPCNEWAGREIDKPFMEDPLLTERRSMVDQRDPRRGGDDATQQTLNRQMDVCRAHGTTLRQNLDDGPLHDAIAQPPRL